MVPSKEVHPSLPPKSHPHETLWGRVAFELGFTTKAMGNQVCDGASDSYVETLPFNVGMSQKMACGPRFPLGFHPLNRRTLAGYCDGYWDPCGEKNKGRLHGKKGNAFHISSPLIQTGYFIGRVMADWGAHVSKPSECLVHTCCLFRRPKKGKVFNQEATDCYLESPSDPLKVVGHEPIL